ncbi:hypothetical protein FB451DRAFT_1187472 [Mycena latifolia]|nr:hypothetical protein FB451DRAFT_1187472 [Mycena latifolia]
MVQARFELATPAVNRKPSLQIAGAVHSAVGPFQGSTGACLLGVEKLRREDLVLPGFQFREDSPSAQLHTSRTVHYVGGGQRMAVETEKKGNHRLWFKPDSNGRLLLKQVRSTPPLNRSEIVWYPDIVEVQTIKERRAARDMKVGNKKRQHCIRFYRGESEDCDRELGYEVVEESRDRRHPYATAFPRPRHGASGASALSGLNDLPPAPSSDAHASRGGPRELTLVSPYLRALAEYIDFALVRCSRINSPAVRLPDRNPPLHGFLGQPHHFLTRCTTCPVPPDIGSLAHLHHLRGVLNASQCHPFDSRRIPCQYLFAPGLSDVKKITLQTAKESFNELLCAAQSHV